MTQLDAYIFIVNEMDDNNAMCSDESTVVACGPTVQDVALQAGNYYIIIEKNGGGTGNFAVTVTAQ